MGTEDSLKETEEVENECCGENEGGDINDNICVVHIGYPVNCLQE